MGIAPSVALLRHFFSLQLVDGEQRSGCVSLQVVAATVDSGIDSMLRLDARGFRKQWVYVDVIARSLLLLLPCTPAKPSSGWWGTQSWSTRGSPESWLVQFEEGGGNDGDGGEGVHPATYRPASVPFPPDVGFHRPRRRHEAPAALSSFRHPARSAPPPDRRRTRRAPSGRLPSLRSPAGGAFAMKTPHFDEWGLLPEGHEVLGNVVFQKISYDHARSI